MKDRIEQLEEENEFCEALNVRLKGEIDQLKIDNTKLLCERQLMIDALEKIHALEPTENQPDFSHIKISAEVLDVVCPIEVVRS